MYGRRSWWDVAKNQILMPREWFGDAFDYARKKNLQALSTVHSVADAEFIMQFDPPALKVASLDVSHTDFLRGLGKFKKPVILSSGMHYNNEIQFAVKTLHDSGISEIILLHCVSAYPPSPASLNLNNIPMLRKATGHPVGFSDHTTGTWAAAAAVALGACLIEKHVTLDRRLKGPDHHFAFEPEMMKELIRVVRNTEKALGSHDRILSDEEAKARKLARRSLVASRQIRQGETLSRKNLKVSRPGSGIHPRQMDEIIGKRAIKTIEKEDLIDWSDVE
jgi:sialic acid synthase SpsE